MASIRFLGVTGKSAALHAPALLDGAMGTALLDRGLEPGALPEEWIFSRPEEIAAVHAAHAAAGARVLLTCTFSCAAPRLEARIDPARIGALCGWAERLARSASRGVLVAGAVGPTGLTPPFGPGVPSAELEARYARPLEALAAAGVDLLWIESQHDRAEALAALRAARATGLPAVVTFTFREERGRLVAPGGADPVAWLAAVEAAGAAAAGVNCVFPGPSLDDLAQRAVAWLAIPLVVKPSPGLPGAVLPPDAFARALEPALRAGVRLAGGCCGSGAAHLAALAAAIARAAPDQAG
jgi:5-methyltetrahydrofolate--homocysteine methyltransferase